MPLFGLQSWAKRCSLTLRSGWDRWLSKFFSVANAVPISPACSVLLSAERVLPLGKTGTAIEYAREHKSCAIFPPAFSFNGRKGGPGSVGAMDGKGSGGVLERMKETALCTARFAACMRGDKFFPQYRKTPASCKGGGGGAHRVTVWQAVLLELLRP